MWLSEEPSLIARTLCHVTDISDTNPSLVSLDQYLDSCLFSLP